MLFVIVVENLELELFLLGLFEQGALVLGEYFLLALALEALLGYFNIILAA